MAAANKRYAFLSYARKDIELVKPIVLALAEAKIPFFIDKPENFAISSGDPKYWFIQFSKTGDYPPDIKEKIRGCSVFVAFPSSSWKDPSNTLALEVEHAVDDQNVRQRCAFVLMDAAAKDVLLQEFRRRDLSKMNYHKYFDGSTSVAKIVRIVSEHTGFATDSTQSQSDLSDINPAVLPYRINRDLQVESFQATLSTLSSRTGKPTHDVSIIHGPEDEEHHQLLKRFEQEIATQVLARTGSAVPWQYVQLHPLPAAQSPQDLKDKLRTFCFNRLACDISNPAAFAGAVARNQRPLVLAAKFDATAGIWKDAHAPAILEFLKLLDAVPPQPFPAVISLALMFSWPKDPSEEQARATAKAQGVIADLVRKHARKTWKNLQIRTHDQLESLTRDTVRVFVDECFSHKASYATVLQSALKILAQSGPRISMRDWGMQFSSALENIKRQGL